LASLEIAQVEMGVQGHQPTFGYRLAEPTNRGTRHAIVTTKDHKGVDGLERAAHSRSDDFCGVAWDLIGNI
jgi:hypothetical protein